MKDKKTSLADALFSQVRQRVLGLLYRSPNTDFHTNEIIRMANSGSGAVQRELESLASAGIIIAKQLGNQKRYQANRDTPFFEELHSIILKSFGLADVIRDALEPIKQQIHIAFIYGSVAKHEDTANSDIDLMIIGNNLIYAEIFGYLEKTEALLKRKINPVLYSLSDWTRKNKEHNHFTNKVSVSPKIFLIGTEDELVKPG